MRDSCPNENPDVHFVTSIVRRDLNSVYLYFVCTPTRSRSVRSTPYIYSVLYMLLLLAPGTRILFCTRSTPPSSWSTYSPSSCYLYTAGHGVVLLLVDPVCLIYSITLKLMIVASCFSWIKRWYHSSRTRADA
jgi:hypothetical protein